MYLHYRYADYVLGGGTSASAEYRRFNASKRKYSYMGRTQGLTSQLQYNNFVAATKANSIYDFDTMVAFLEGEFDIFNDNTQNLTGVDSDRYNVKNTSVKGMSDGGSASQGDIDALAERIDSFQSALTRVIDSCGKMIGGNIEAYKQTIIESYCATRGVNPGTSAFSERVLKDFLKYQGIVRLKLDYSGNGELSGANNVLRSCLTACTLLAESLPSYGSGGGMSLGARAYSTQRASSTRGRNRRTSGSEETLDTLIKKTQGLFSNVVGVARNIAREQAHREAVARLDEMNKKILSTIPRTTAGKGITVTTTVQVGNLKENMEQLHSVSKGHATVSVSKDNITVYYDGEKKDTKFNSSTHAEQVAIKSSTSFLEAYSRTFPEDRGYSYLYNTAAGKPGRSIARGQVGDLTVSGAELSAMWKEIVDTTVATNILYMLTSMLTRAGSSAIYLINGSSVTPITDILSKLTFNNINTKIQSEETGKLMGRNTFMSMNKWLRRDGTTGGRVSTLEKSTVMAQARSEGLVDSGALYARFREAKLTVSLKDLARFL